MAGGRYFSRWGGASGDPSPVKGRGRTAASLLALSLAASILSVRPAPAVQTCSSEDTFVCWGPPASATGAVGSSIATTGDLLTSVATTLLRPATPESAQQVRVLLISTGVARSAFPPALQSSAYLTGDLVDYSGWGTWAASTLLQLLPSVSIRSKSVGTNGASASLLEQALAMASDAPAAYDVVLIAINPAWLLEPVAALANIDDRAIEVDPLTGLSRWGSRWDLVQQTVLKYPGITDDGDRLLGIPKDAGLRQRVFAGAKGKERTAVEDAVGRASGWERVVAKLRTLQQSGVPVVVPAGDWPATTDCATDPSCKAVSGQRVVGLAALAEVITVGASYDDVSDDCMHDPASPACAANPRARRLSPISARGPTLDQHLKPDVLAPSDLVGLLPATSTVAQALPATPRTQDLNWAPAAACSDGTSWCVGSGVEHVLQGSSLVSASVAAAQLGQLVASGWPNPAALRLPDDAKVLRGLAWAKASAHPVSASRPGPGTPGRIARPWEQGAGELPVIATAPADGTIPIPLAPFATGDVPFDAERSITVPLWSRGKTFLPASAPVSTTAFVGAKPDGAIQQLAYSDPTGSPSASATVTGSLVSLTAERGLYQGGLYLGTIDLGGTSFPTEVSRTVSLTFFGRHPWVGQQEFEDQVTLALMPGLPPQVGPLGAAYKRMPPGLADVVLRSAPTRGMAPWDATIPDVPPGFYRVYLLEDHAPGVEQFDAPYEEIGPSVAGLGITGVFVSSLPACAGVTGTVVGPLSVGGSTCLSKDGALSEYAGTSFGPGFEQRLGLCTGTGSNGVTTIPVHIYCQPATIQGATGVFSRTIHLPAYRDFDFCGVNLSPSGETPLDTIVALSQDAACSSTMQDEGSSGWAWSGGASGCGSGDSASMLPEDSDSATGVWRGTVSLTQPGEAGASLPVTILKYDFTLPHPNEGLHLTVNFNYRLENAIVVLFAVAGSVVDATPDTVEAALVTDDPRTIVEGTLERRGATGSVSWQAGLISGGATRASVGALVIPTTWVDAGPVADSRLEICNLGVRASTFARALWSDPGAGIVQQLGAKVTHTSTADLLNEITPRTQDSGYCRTRTVWDAAAAPPSFGALGGQDVRRDECEEIWLGFEVPKNDGVTQYHLPKGVLESGVAASHLAAVKSGSTDMTQVMKVATGLYDPVRGVTEYKCRSESLDQLCIAKQRQEVYELFPDMVVNGRFYSTLPVADQELRRTTAAGHTRGSIVAEVHDVAGTPAFDYPRCTGGVTQYCKYYTEQLDPVTKQPLPDEEGHVAAPGVGTFYSAKWHPEFDEPSSDVVSGTVSIAFSGLSDQPYLVIKLRPFSGEDHVITANLNCITIDEGTPLCRP